MPIPNIQNNKYTPSPLPEICTPRGGLLARIDSMAEKKLVLVSAPAGSGKSVSALLWMRASGRKTVWIGLDAFDNSVSVFYRMFCTGILSAQPANERMIAILHDPAFTSSPVEHTINLLSEFLLDGNEYVLALDDFHTITNGEIIKSLPFILRRLPHSFVTLILSRADLANTFTEFAGNSLTDVIGPNDLVFDINEVKAYFTALGRDVADVEAEAALAYTGGWAIGVSALVHSAAPAPDGYGGYVLEKYIGKHIWAEWDENLRAFMLASAALDEMPVALCKTVTGRADAGELLETLRAQNAFVTRIGDDVYRYHHLFLDFLRSQPEYAEADKKNRWHAAAEYYVAQNDAPTARRYAHKSGDTEIIVNTWYAFMDNRGFSIDAYLDYAKDFFLSQPMDALFEKCPVLYISRAWIAYLTGDARSFEEYEDKLRKLMPIILLKYPQFGEMMFMLIALDYRTPFAKQIAKASLLPPIPVQGEELRAASMSIQLPFLHRSCRNFHELTDAKLHAKLKKTFGKLLKNHYEMVMHAVTSGLLLEQNHVNEALTEAQSAVTMLNTKTAKEMRFAAFMHLAAAYLASEKKADMLATLGEAERFIKEQAQFLIPNFLAFTTKIKLWDCDLKAAREWLDNYFVNNSPMPELYRIYQYFTTVRAYAALGELETAEDIAVRLRRLSENYRRPLDSADAGTLLSSIQWARGQKIEAQETMEAVLLDMQPRAFIRVVADEGAAVLPVIKKVLQKSEQADYQGALDRVYVNNVYLAAYAVSKQRAGILAGIEAPPVKLSRQQRMILDLLAGGYKRDDIVKISGLTLNTVKSHLKLVYEKLGVSSSADAVVRARELGII